MHQPAFSGFLIRWEGVYRVESTPERDVGWKIKRLHSAYAQFRERNIQKLDLTSTQAFLLGYLSRHRDTPVYAGDIGRDFGLRHPTVSGLLSRMEQKDFIRYAADKDHRRKQIILTERALAVHEQIIEQIHATNALATASLTEDEVVTLHRLLDQVYTNLTASSENVEDTCLPADESFEKKENP